ncbi:YfhO family protein [Muriicola sp. Z0-33]|uniref:YfhO family protein n=1 Tax=Muriicola sp. Z0-33 TaxID=2816957 RepID=UPI0022370E50|nr:YfhO family protein [Muriicola sp. Z0-33]MCW5516636.1 YfhO family protein [Muriicola sp. Z0-33]
MSKKLNALFVHFFALAFFVLASLVYFYPVLQGKTIRQSDIEQFSGMAKEQNDFRKRTDQEPYWTNSAFGGMPTYQLGAYYPHDYVKKLDRVIRFLPRPADYLFLYFIGFYILLCCMKVDYRLAVLGALAFGFSTYFIIILGVGHNAKAHAIGYLPILLGGIILTFRRKYLWGFVLSALGMALEVGANHYQMTYYFMLLVLVLGVVYLIDAIRKKVLKHYFTAVGILLLAVVLGISANATALMATKEYADWSTRGKSALTINPDGSAKEKTDGLSKDYITQWSYGITESLNLYVPRLFGGSNGENLGEDSKTYNYLLDQGLPRTRALEFTSNLPLYWGPQPGTSGPAYIGAIVFFLFIMGLFLVRGRVKWWLLGGVILSLLLSWGKNFSLLTNFMIDYFPLYDKFRAVSSIQVLLELCAPIMAIMTLVVLFKPTVGKEKKMKALKLGFLVSMGIGVGLLLFKGSFDFSAANDAAYQRYFGDEVLAMIVRDREAVYINDTIRSLIFVVLAALAMWLFLKERIRQNILVMALGLFILVDLVGVDRRYVNKDNFVRQRLVDRPFQESAVDKEIRQDKGIFRVYDQTQGFEGARTSYFHQAISGYHAAKPARMQDLYDFHIQKGNIGVFNMMNIKYVIQQDEEGKSYAGINPDANGNAWFISKLKEVSSADEEIMSLDSLDLKNEAVINSTVFSNINRFNFQKDSISSVTLTAYKPNHLTYRTRNSYAGVAVFSEMYYPNGWNAYIDGKMTNHFKVNYALRAMRVPAGDHIVEFKFEPVLINTGSKITLGSSLLLGLIIFGGIGFSYWRRKSEAKSGAAEEAQ